MTAESLAFPGRFLDYIKPVFFYTIEHPLIIIWQIFGANSKLSHQVFVMNNFALNFHAGLRK